MDYGVFEYNWTFYRVRQDAERDAEQTIYDSYDVETMTTEELQKLIDTETAKIEEIDENEIHYLLNDMKEAGAYMGYDYQSALDELVEYLNV